MSAREEIFARVEAAVSGLEGRVVLPEIQEIKAVRSRLALEDASIEELVAAFQLRMEEANGKVTFGWAGLQELLAGLGVKQIYLESAAEETLGKVEGEFVRSYERGQVDEVDCAITLATAGIAETGTLVLTDRNTPNRLAALAPWVHVAVLAKTAIRPSLLDALSNLEKDPSVVFVTGPSKTADIEGILIEGVHGPGIQVCVIV